MRTNDERPITEQLIRLMKERTDGNWEFLATAAGATSSVERTLEGLTIETLYLTSFPSEGLIQRRVEALAALDVMHVLLVAEHWPRLGEFRGNGSSHSLRGFVEAWRAALPFLPEQIQQDVLRGEVPTALEEEKTALLSPVPHFETWEELIVFVEHAESYAELRMTDRAIFPEEPVPEACVRVLLEIPPAGRWRPFESLRVLRRRATRLAGNAKAHVLGVAQSAWVDFSADEPGALILFELARSLDPQTSVIECGVRHLVEALQGVSDPLPLLRAAYVVADTGFMMP